MARLVAALGRNAVDSLGLVGALARFSGRTLSRGISLRPSALSIDAKVFFNQVWFSGVQALPLVAVIAVLIGGASIIQSVNLLTGVADAIIGTLLVSIIIRELGPLIVAIILVGRSGTAMAAELGYMRLQGEIEVLEAHRIDTFAFVVAPRALAATAAMFALIIVFDVMGILGGALIAVALKDVSLNLLLSRVLRSLTNADVLSSALKALLFGQAVAIPACFYGLRVRRSATELPQAVTQAVVFSLVALFLLDIVLAAIFYL